MKKIIFFFVLFLATGSVAHGQIFRYDCNQNVSPFFQQQVYVPQGQGFVGNQNFFQGHIQNQNCGMCNAFGCITYQTVQQQQWNQWNNCFQLVWVQVAVQTPCNQCGFCGRRFF
jgi:hypothetical protein